MNKHTLVGITILTVVASVFIFLGYKCVEEHKRDVAAYQRRPREVEIQWFSTWDKLPAIGQVCIVRFAWWGPHKAFFVGVFKWEGPVFETIPGGERVSGHRSWHPYEF